MRERLTGKGRLGQQAAQLPRRIRSGPPAAFAVGAATNVNENSRAMAAIALRTA